ncbi:galactose oxidase early set domain-containing protein [Frankia sp. EI5c]|uniref:galactose oxidase early set domain-containing protein n=1 Tax=Frankia sp. EI5c TaxID=683316 RepID=UPI001F5BD836|nr:galactose oxidase early set domain-containing protein [Frankia sp. EI5c]
MSRDRPAVSAAPAQFDYGQSYDLTVSGDIGRATLIRPSSVTHSSDSNQRSVDLTVTGTGTTISVAVPSNPNLAPPGYYMLFVQDSAGVPSVARWVHVG